MFDGFLIVVIILIVLIVLIVFIVLNVIDKFASLSRFKIIELDASSRLTNPYLTLIHNVNHSILVIINDKT